MGCFSGNRRAMLRMMGDAVEGERRATDPRSAAPSTAGSCNATLGQS
jgi:hypothetical protein